MLPEAGAMTTVLAATRDPCDAFAYIARARNGGRLSDDQIALADLYANHADFGELGWTFDHVFDTSVTVSEALARVARAVVAERVTQGGKLHLVRDLPSTAPIAMFSPRNINAGTFSAHFLPNLRRYAMTGLAIVLALAVIGLLWFRGQYEGEKAARITDRAAEQAKVLEIQLRAAALSDELIIRQAIAIGNSSNKAGSYVSQIRSAPDADRRRVASRGVRDLVQGGGGGPPAVGGAPAAVPGPGAGARP